MRPNEIVPFSNGSNAVTNCSRANTSMGNGDPSQDASLRQLSDLSLDSRRRCTQCINMCYCNKGRQLPTVIQDLSNPRRVHPCLLGHITEHSVTNILHELWHV